MTTLFGLDIAQIVNDAITDAGGLRPGTLQHLTAGTRAPTDPAAGTQPTQTDHTFQGFVEVERVVTGGSTVRGVTTVTLMGASIDPPVEPKAGDTVVVDEVAYRLGSQLDSDPAKAVYAFIAQT